ncbi:Transcription factor bHLH69 [Zea mays]|nr:Transcription factor bHLH69 [Zea mays]
MAGAVVRGGREGAGWRRAGGADAAPAAALGWGWGPVRRLRLAGVAAPAAPNQRRRRRGGREADGAAAAGRSEAGTPCVAAGHGPLDLDGRQQRRRPAPPALSRQWRIGRRRAGATQSCSRLRRRRSRRRLRRFLRRIAPPPPAAAAAFSITSAACPCSRRSRPWRPTAPGVGLMARARTRSSSSGIIPRTPRPCRSRDPLVNVKATAAVTLTAQP